MKYVNDFESLCVNMYFSDLWFEYFQYYTISLYLNVYCVWTECERSVLFLQLHIFCFLVL